MRLVLLATALVAAAALPAHAAPTTVTGRTCGMDWPSTASPDGTVSAGPVAVTDPPSLAAGVTVAIACFIGEGDPTYQDTRGKLGLHSGYDAVVSIGPGLASFGDKPVSPVYVCTTLEIKTAPGAVVRYYFDAWAGTFVTTTTASCATAVPVSAGGNTSVTSPEQPFTQTF